MTTFDVTPIGFVHCSRTDPAETDHWGDVESTIVVDERFGDDCLVGLDGFSHVEVLFVFHELAERSDYRGLFRSRGRSDMPELGIFANRGPRRPNRLGVTACPIASVDGRTLRVRGLDAIAGTPVLDLKPVMARLLPTRVREPAWATLLMRDYLD